MKVVLFCGGLGTRLGGLSNDVPKPMVKIGYRPILWHVMKYYAHFGHKDFILCLGYRADVIKDYFLNYNEYHSNDFVMTNGGQDLELKNTDIGDWRISFVDTGLRSNIGQRLKMVEPYLEGQTLFLANYSDGLTDAPLPDMIERLQKSDKIASCICVKPSQSFHVVDLDEDSNVKKIEYIQNTDTIINGGYFVFRREIFDYIRPGEELVIEPFHRLIAESQLIGYRYDNFWCMDTFKEHQELNDMHNQGNAPWEIWNGK